MTEPKKFWLTDGQDNFALVAGAEERDRWLPLGWSEAGEPTDGWVHIWRDGIEQPGLVPVTAVDSLWGPLGWVPGPPPGGAHPATAVARADQPAENKPEPKPAAGGIEKGK